MPGQPIRSVFGTHLFFIAVFAVVVLSPALAQRVGTVHPPAKVTPGTRPSGVSFLPVVTYSTGGSAPSSIAVADLNGDGKPDLVAAGEGAKYSSGSIEVLLGNGDGTFQTATTYSSGAYSVSSMVVADVNGDGRPDLIVSGCSFQKTVACPINSSGTVSILLGNGDGTFKAAVVYNSGGLEASAIVVADANGDGKPDILVTNTCFVTNPCGYLPYHDGAVSVLLGNGDGTFQSAVNYDSGGLGPISIAISDVNGDGKMDLLVANCGCFDGLFPDTGSVSVLLGNGDGTFGAAVLYNSGGSAPWSVAVADVNGDHKPDLVVANSCWCGRDASVGVLLGNGDGTFQSAVTYDSGGELAVSVVIADVNRDGTLDLVVENQCPNSDCNTPSLTGVLLGNGDGTFQPVSTFDSGGRAVSVAVADVNGDGWPDLLTEDWGVVGVLLNAGSGEQAPTTTTVASALNPSTYGQAVTFTAKVTSSSGTPTGTVILLNGSTTAGSGTLSNGNATIMVSSLPAGIDSITAAYQGTTAFAPSTSAPLAQTVTVATTATSLTSSLNPAGTNQPVIFTATVTSQYGGAVTGSVVFSSGSQALGTASLSGNTASLTTSFSTTGTYSISAKYNGDGDNIGSTSSTLSEVILASTTTTLVSSLNPSVVGQAVTFTAAVSSSAGIPPNGETITFKNGSSVLGTAPLSGGTASLTTSSLAAGIYTITASYPGDSNFAASTSPGLRQVVNSTTKSATATTLVSSLNPSTYGQSVSLTATVTTSGSVPPTGKVNFTWSIYTIGSAILNSSGVATLTKSNLNADTYPLTAVYVGDASNRGSTSSVVSQVVTQATSSATLTSSPNPSTSGQVVTFTATITSPTAKPTGPVTFAVGKTVLGTAQLSGGKAKFVTTTLAVGSTTVTATYNGNSNIAKSSASATQTVH
jgi:hypothetical protein